MPVQTWTPGQTLTAAEMKTLTDLLPFPSVTTVNVSPCVPGNLYRCQPAGGATLTMTLPAPTTAGQLLAFKLDAATGAVLVQHNSAELIYLPAGSARGVVSVILNTPDALLLLVSDGANWHTLGMAPPRASLTSTAGPPAAGTWAAGDEITDKWGASWLCVSAGTPGTWRFAGGGCYSAVVRFSSTIEQAIPNATDTKLTNWSVVADPAGMYDATNHRLTVPVPGIYLATLAGTWAVQASVLRSVYIARNGATTTDRVSEQETPPNSISGLARPSCGGLVAMAATDYVEAWAYQNCGTALNFGDGFGDCRFSISLLSSSA